MIVSIRKNFIHNVNHKEIKRMLTMGLGIICISGSTSSKSSAMGTYYLHNEEKKIKYSLE